MPFWTPPRLAAALFALALTRSLVIALIIAPSYGSDGAGYLRYAEVLGQTPTEDILWDIRGTTPIYPLFAYVALGAGALAVYALVWLQVLMGAAMAPGIFYALRAWGWERAALIAGALVAIDPQTGLLLQQVATEGLYIILLGWGLAAFLYALKQAPAAPWIFGLGVLLGLGALSRPVGWLLILPYGVFYLAYTRSLGRALWLGGGYGAVWLLISLFNLWQWGFFAPYSTSGIYLGTRLFGVEGLYSPDNGPESERLFYLAGRCYLQLDEGGGIPQDLIAQELRFCLSYRLGFSLEEISRSYQRAYGEASRRHPTAFLRSLAGQSLAYMWQTSDPQDLAMARGLASKCSSPPPDGAPWYEKEALFCPKSPEPLAFLQEPLFWAILGFGAFTRAAVFPLGAVVVWWGGKNWKDWQNGAWLLLICLGLYAYHMVVTAAAGTILARYVTVTNLYLLISAALILAWAAEKMSPIGAILKPDRA